MHMDTKQKALLVLTFVAFGYLGYEVYGLMKNDMGDVPPVTASYHSAQAEGPVAVANAAEPRPTLKPIPAASKDYHSPLVTGQKAYLHMVNQYELAKMKRRLLEEKAAIAAAQHRIATLNKQTREIDDSLAGSPQTYDDTEMRHATPFQLSYVDHQNGKWSATLNRNGRYYEVHPGSTLSDGSKVIAIDRQGVTLTHGKERVRITFNGSIPLPPETATKAMPPKKTAEVLELEQAARRALAETSILKNKPMHGHLKPTNAVVKAEEKVVATKKIKMLPVKSAVKTALKKTPQKKHTSNAMLASTKVAPAIPAVKKIVDNQPLKKLKPISVKRHPRFTEDERRILALPKHAYSIQLIGSYHRDIVENFAIANDLGNRAMEFYVINRGKPWYVLIYGNYPTRKVAEKALENLPPDLTPENPWVRPVASLQRDILRHKHRA